MTATAALSAWPGDVLARSQALLIEGPPGSGKTFLLADLLAHAPNARVLRARPAQVETRLIGSALIDLCNEVSDAEILELPSIQAAALSAAVLRSDADTANPQAVALAFTTLIRQTAEHQPVLICIDDSQWLDAQTTDILTFAARRLPDAGVGIVLTRRIEPGETEPAYIAELDAALPLRRETVRGLSDPELDALLRDRLGNGIPSNVLRAAIGSARGNPLYALEVARALLSRDRRASPNSLPLPTSLAELVGRHVTDLPESTRVCLAAASALRRPTIRDLRALGVAESLDAAEAAGLVTVQGHDITFTHPLYAAAAYDSLGAGERRHLHTSLAEVVRGQEERARHLVLGAFDADEDVAAALDTARDQAVRRGALDAALDAAQLGVQATPEASPNRTSRRITLGNLLFRSGDSDEARAELRAAVDEAESEHAKARALHALARIVNDTEGPHEAIPLELEALEKAGNDKDLIAAIQMGLAVSHVTDWSVAVEHGRAAVEMLEASADPDPLQLAAALTALVGPQFYAGQGADIASCLRAMELQDGDLSLPVSDRALSVLFYLELWTDDFPAAREHIKKAYRLCEEEGDEASRCYTLVCHVQLEVRSGLWDEADRLIDECIDLARNSNNEFYVRSMQTQRTWLAAYRGDLDAAIAAATADIEHGMAIDNGLLEQRGRGLRGFCELTAGDALAAAEDFDRYIALFAANNAAEPALRQLSGDHVEALVALGRLDDAEAALTAMREPAEALDRTAVLAAAARAEAMLRSEQGDSDGALAAAERSLQLYDQIERRFDRARAQLVKGQVHRRARQKALAKQELTGALEAFEALGARGFAEKARVELSRVGLRPAATQDLTETERQIATLTATGMTSAEIAKTLFLSTKTVSANLTRIYRKLNVRNRAELSALLSRIISHHVNCPLVPVINRKYVWNFDTQLLLISG